MASPEIIESPRQEGSAGQDRNQEFVREFRVLWREPGLRPADILTLDSIPRPFDPHPSNPFALAIKPRAIQDSRFLWRVVVDYSIDLAEKRDQEEDPLARPAEINLRSVRRTVPIFIDKDGNPITNAAGDLVVGHTREISDYVLNVRKFVQSVPDWVDAYQDAVNDSAIRVFGKTWAPRHLKFNDLAVDEIEDARGTYYAVSFVLQHRRESWDLQYLNTGRRELVPAASGNGLSLLPEEEQAKARVARLRDILVGDPERVTNEEVFLDDEGRAIRDLLTGTIKTQLEPSEIIVLRKRIYPELPFDRLPIR